MREGIDSRLFAATVARTSRDARLPWRTSRIALRGATPMNRGGQLGMELVRRRAGRLWPLGLMRAVSGNPALPDQGHAVRLRA